MGGVGVSIVLDVPICLCARVVVGLGNFCTLVFLHGAVWTDLCEIILRDGWGVGLSRGLGIRFVLKMY